jgi:hypothetical protein
MSKRQCWSRHVPPQYEDGAAPEVEIIFRDVDTLNDHERAAKRRRIERQAEDYLRGNTLYLQSAVLRGPFEDWSNPWRSKGVVVEEKELAVISASSKKLLKKQYPTKQMPGSSKAVSKGKKIVEIQFKDISTVAVDEPGNNLAGELQPTLLERARHPKTGRQKAPRKEQWLKRIDEDFMPAVADMISERKEAGPSTPTRTSRRRKPQQGRNPRPSLSLPALELVENIDAAPSSPLSDVEPSRLPPGRSLDTPIRHISQIPSSKILVEATSPPVTRRLTSQKIDERVVETPCVPVANYDLQLAATRSLDLIASQEFAELFTQNGSYHENEQMEDAQQAHYEDESHGSTPEAFQVTELEEEAMLLLAREHSYINKIMRPIYEPQFQPKISSEEVQQSDETHSDEYATAPQEQHDPHNDHANMDIPLTPNSEEFSGEVDNVERENTFDASAQIPHVSIPEHQDSKAYSSLADFNIDFVSEQTKDSSNRGTEILRAKQPRRKGVRLTDLQSPEPKLRRGSRSSQEHMSLSGIINPTTKSNPTKRATFAGWTISKSVHMSDENKDPSSRTASSVEEPTEMASAAPSETTGNGETTSQHSILRKRSSLKLLHSLTQSNTQAFPEVSFLPSATYSSIPDSGTAGAPASHQMGQRMFPSLDNDEEEPNVDAVLDDMVSFLSVDYAF